MNNKYGFGIIGLGAIAGLHAKAIGEIKNADVAAVYDSIPGRAASFAEQHGGRPYDDLGAFFKDDATKFVIIATPSGLHLDAAVAAARAGKHVIVEKPLEITAERCREIIKAAAENGVMLSGIFQGRFSPAARKIREALDRKRFGKIILCDAYVKWYRSQEYYDSGAWRGTRDIDGGGALINQAIHALDLLLWFGGNVKEVSARAATLAHERIEVEDTLVSTVLFESGAMGTVTATTAVWPGSLRRIEVLGTEGTAIIEEDIIVRWDFAKEDPGDEEIRKSFCGGSQASGASDPMAISFTKHQMQFEDCIRAVETGGKPLVDGREATKAVALVEAMYKSAANGGKIQAYECRF
jgi:predicted dehydrogenase